MSSAECLSFGGLCEAVCCRPVRGALWRPDRRATDHAASAAAPATPAAPAPGPGRGGRGGAALRSPEVAPDGRVTFRLRAPNAQRGLRQRLRRAARDAEGRAGRLDGDERSAEARHLYVLVQRRRHEFQRPGAIPRSRRRSANAGTSLLRVPGGNVWDAARPCRRARSRITSTNPASSATTATTTSTRRRTTTGTAGSPTPCSTSFTVSRDDAYGWISVGAANVILDNLIAQGKAKPMIMVNTLGYGTTDAQGRTTLTGPQQMRTSRTRC